MNQRNAIYLLVILSVLGISQTGSAELISVQISEDVTTSTPNSMFASETLALNLDPSTTNWVA
jgi:hypothetical protein